MLSVEVVFCISHGAVRFVRPIIINLIDLVEQFGRVLIIHSYIYIYIYNSCFIIYLNILTSTRTHSVFSFLLRDCVFVRILLWLLSIDT
jgi:hypothetical protein